MKGSVPSFEEKDFQENIAAKDYEVIIIANGSTLSFRKDEVTET